MPRYIGVFGAVVLVLLILIFLTVADVINWK